MERLVLVGFQGSGKNTVGEILVRDFGYTGISFADSLKDCVATIFQWDRNLLEGITEEARAWRETVDPWWAERLGIPNFSPRWAMRNFGTDVMREHFHTDVWILNVEKRIRNIGGKVVVFDGRFPNEIDMVRNLGGFSIRVKRGPEPSYWQTALSANNPLTGKAAAKAYREALKDIHPSEWAWIGHKIDFVIENDGSKQDLVHHVQQLFAGS